MEILILVIVILFVLFLRSKSNFGQAGPEYTSSSSGSSELLTVFIIYAPWCGHCKNSMPEFEKASRSSDNILLINSDDPANESILSQYGVKSFPTIIKSDGTSYFGNRKSEDILKFAKK